MKPWMLVLLIGVFAIVSLVAWVMHAIEPVKVALS